MQFVLGLSLYEIEYLGTFKVQYTHRWHKRTLILRISKGLLYMCTHSSCLLWLFCTQGYIKKGEIEYKAEAFKEARETYEVSSLWLESMTRPSILFKIKQELNLSRPVDFYLIVMLFSQDIIIWSCNILYVLNINFKQKGGTVCLGFCLWPVFCFSVKFTY